MKVKKKLKQFFYVKSHWIFIDFIIKGINYIYSMFYCYLNLMSIYMTFERQGQKIPLLLTLIILN